MGDSRAVVSAGFSMDTGVVGANLSGEVCVDIKCCFLFVEAVAMVTDSLDVGARIATVTGSEGGRWYCSLARFGIVIVSLDGGGISRSV